MIMFWVNLEKVQLQELPNEKKKKPFFEIMSGVIFFFFLNRILILFKSHKKLFYNFDFSLKKTKIYDSLHLKTENKMK